MAKKVEESLPTSHSVLQTLSSIESAYELEERYQRDGMSGDGLRRYDLKLKKLNEEFERRQEELLLIDKKLVELRQLIGTTKSEKLETANKVKKRVTQLARMVRTKGLTPDVLKKVTEFIDQLEEDE